MTRATLSDLTPTHTTCSSFQSSKSKIFFQDRIPDHHFAIEDDTAVSSEIPYPLSNVFVEDAGNELCQTPFSNVRAIEIGYYQHRPGPTSL